MPMRQCCPPETATVVTVQTVDGIKGLSNCFVHVLANNTVYYVDRKHHITQISSNIVEVEQYDVDSNPSNFRGQIAYDTSTQDLIYFTYGGKGISFSGSVTQADLDKVIADVAANTSSINTLTDEIGELQTGQADLSQSVAVLGATEVQKDTTISGDESTVTISKSLGSLTGEGTETVMPLPVASEANAGVMNSATYAAVQANAEDINSILGGAVVVSDLPAEPTQAELTDQWKAETGKTALINRASIYDEANKLVWYYYENVEEWKSMPAGDAAVSVSIATNDTLGIVKGSDDVFIEPDGSMSVVGLDKINSDIENLQSEMPKLPSSMVYDFVSPAGANNPSTADNANITARVVNTTTGNVTNSTLMMPMASSTQAGSVTAADKSKLTDLPAITEIGENLELTDEGVLNATGGSKYVLPTYVLGGGDDRLIAPITDANTITLTTIAMNTATGASHYPNPVLPAATSSKAGVMASGDKSKLDSIPPIKSIGDNLTLSDTGVLSATGGGSVKLYGTYGENTDGAPTQKFFSNRLNNSFVLLGANAGDCGDKDVVIGSSATGSGGSNWYTVALGVGASALYGGQYSVALGAYSETQRAAEISVGSGGTNVNHNTRFVANVRDGVLDHDAVNVSQLNNHQFSASNIDFSSFSTTDSNGWTTIIPGLLWSKSVATDAVTIAQNATVTIGTANYPVGRSYNNTSMTASLQVPSDTGYSANAIFSCLYGTGDTINLRASNARSGDVSLPASRVSLLAIAI